MRGNKGAGIRGIKGLSFTRRGRGVKDRCPLGEEEGKDRREAKRARAR